MLNYLVNFIKRFNVRDDYSINTGFRYIRINEYIILALSSVYVVYFRQRVVFGKSRFTVFPKNVRNGLNPVFYLFECIINYKCKDNFSLYVNPSLVGKGYYHWLFDKLPYLDAIQLEKELSVINWSVTNIALLSNLTQKGVLYPSTQEIRWLRDFAEIVVKNDKFFPKRIYISRQRCSERLLMSEKELKNRLTIIDVTTVFLEDYSFVDQIEMFRRAELIIGIHGAGLANIVFCNSKAQLIEIFSESEVKWHYALISQILGLRYSPVITKDLTFDIFTRRPAYIAIDDFDFLNTIGTSC